MASLEISDLVGDFADLSDLVGTEINCCQSYTDPSGVHPHVGVRFIGTLTRYDDSHYVIDDHGSRVSITPETFAHQDVRRGSEMVMDFPREEQGDPSFWAEGSIEHLIAVQLMGRDSSRTQGDLALWVDELSGLAREKRIRNPKLVFGLGGLNVVESE